MNPDGTWSEQKVSLLSAVSFTSNAKFIDYAAGLDTNISGFARAVDDAIQVLEFIHSSDLIVYNPYY